MVASRDSESARAWVIDASNQFSAIRGSDGSWREDIPSPLEVRHFNVIEDHGEIESLFQEAWQALRGGLRQSHFQYQIDRGAGS